MPKLLLMIACIGLVSSTVFLLLAIAAAFRFRSARQNFLYKARERHVRHPGVSLLKPLHGLEARLQENLESFFSQDYADFEIIFGVRNSHDPALPLMKSIASRYPHVPVKSVICGEPDGANAKVSLLKRMISVADKSYLVISDSDVHVSPDYLQQVIRPLQDPEVGLVTCLYRGVAAGGFWSRLEALGMSVEMQSGVLIAEMLEGMRFALGPSMATRKEVLQAAGGFQALADYCADDFVLGKKVHHSGKQVVLSSYIVEHMALNTSLRAALAHQLRWMKGSRFSRPKGHVGTGLTFAMPFGMLALVAAWLGGSALLGLSLFAWAALNRILLALIVGWGVTRDRQLLRLCWLYPVRDLCGFVLWVASFFGTRVVWRGETYKLTSGGKMVPAQRSASSVAAAASGSSSRTVAIDDFA